MMSLNPISHLKFELPPVYVELESNLSPENWLPLVDDELESNLSPES